MLTELASRNDDIRRLLDKGYALRVDGGYLVVRDIPYLAFDRAQHYGALVAKLVFVDRVQVKPESHVTYFAGSVPHGLDGAPIPNLNGSAYQLLLSGSDTVVERMFSNKPQEGFSNFFDIVEHYVALVSGPAIQLHGSTPLTFRIDEAIAVPSVFKFRDTLTSRAEIGDLSSHLGNDVIAIIGLGGTGSYVLDFLVKTPVAEIRGFDADRFYVHNAFRSPGRLDEQELGKAKAEVYQQRYESFRDGLKLKVQYVDIDCANDLNGVTFAFVCIDRGSARREIFDLLIRLRMPFIDVGMGLNRNTTGLSGMIRATYFAPDDAARVRDMQLAELVDDPDDVYRANVQIAELNALNASLAVARYKQIRGFYASSTGAYHMLLDLESLRTYFEVSQ